MTAPHSNAHQTQPHGRWVTDPGTFPPAPPAPPQPDRNRTLLILLAAALAGAMLVGIAVLAALLTRDEPAATPAASTVTVSGEVVLQIGQFVFRGAENPPCQGLDAYADISQGAQVTITDAAGKVLAVAALDQGVTGDLTTMSDGTRRATSCSLRFAAPGVPAGAGPYGVEVGRRGVVHFNEDQLGNVWIGF